MNEKTYFPVWGKVSIVVAAACLLREMSYGRQCISRKMGDDAQAHFGVQELIEKPRGGQIPSQGTH
jgi:hypothetical protein